jgi:hypothetical protein
VPNNQDSVSTLVNLSLQQFIATIANNPPANNARAFVDPMGEFFEVLKLEFLV